MDRPDLKEALSQETLISLQQLEPSPIQSPLDLDKQLPAIPPPSPPLRSFTIPGLSGSGHGAVYYRIAPHTKPKGTRYLTDNIQ